MHFFLGIAIDRGELTMIYFSVVFFLHLTFLLLRSLSAVSNSFYLSFLHSSPTLSRSLSMQSPSQFRSSSPPFPFHFLGICSLPVFHLPFFYMTSPCAPHQFRLRTFLHSNLHSQFIHVLSSALLTPTVILTRCVYLANLNFSCCFSVSVIVSSAFKYAGVTHELSIFP